MNSREGNQEEEVMVSFEGKCTGVREGRPMEKVKGREKEEKENMKAKDDSDVMGSTEAKEHQRARGRSRTREKNPRDKSSNGTCDNWRKRGEEEAGEMWHESRKEQRIEKWCACR